MELESLLRRNRLSLIFCNLISRFRLRGHLIKTVKTNEKQKFRPVCFVPYTKFKRARQCLRICLRSGVECEGGKP